MTHLIIGAVCNNAQWNALITAHLKTQTNTSWAAQEPDMNSFRFFFFLSRVFVNLLPKTGMRVVLQLTEALNILCRQLFFAREMECSIDCGAFY